MIIWKLQCYSFLECLTRKSRYNLVKFCFHICAVVDSKFEWFECLIHLYEKHCDIIFGEPYYLGNYTIDIYNFQLF